MEKQVDAVIIGAGISGLSCACLLKKEGLEVIVLEARDRVGGRTLTLRDPEHGAVDVGGAYVGPTQRRVLRVIRELGLQVYDIDESQENVLQLCGHWSKFKGTIPPMRNPLAYLDLQNAIRTIDRMAKQIDLAAPWTTAQADHWDKMTAQELFNKLCWTKETRQLLRIFVNSVFAAEAHEMSLLFFLTYIQSGHGIARISSISNGAQEKKIVGGSQQICEKMSERLGGSVHLSCPVSSVVQEEGWTVVTTRTGRAFKCRYVVSSVPLPLLSKIQFSPPLPALKTQLIQRVPMGSIIKTVTFYQTAFWRGLNLNGVALSDEGVSAYCIDDTKPDGSHPAIMAFILADRSRGLTELCPGERKLKICEHLAKTFSCKQFLQPTGYVEKNWMEEEFSGGCYTATLPPGVLTRYGRTLRTPFKRVYFAGTETARRWMGYMDGAIESGERAARELLQRAGEIPEGGERQEEGESEPIPGSWLEDHSPSVPGLLLAVLLVLLAVLLAGLIS